MSDTHGIYVAGFNDGYRVAYCGCIEDIYRVGALSVEGKIFIGRLFGDSTIHDSKVAALEAAHNVAEEYSSLGYGVTYLGHLGLFCTVTIKDGSAPTMTAEEVLVRFMKNFHATYGGGLEWSYVSGLSVQQVEGKEFFKELSRYLDKKVLDDIKRYSKR